MIKFADRAVERLFIFNETMPPLLALDHVLISPGLGASAVRTQAIEGQEHRALLVVIDMADGQAP